MSSVPKSRSWWVEGEGGDKGKGKRRAGGREGWGVRQGGVRERGVER